MLRDKQSMPQLIHPGDNEPQICSFGGFIQFKIRKEIKSNAFSNDFFIPNFGSTNKQSEQVEFGWIKKRKTITVLQN